MNEPDIADVSNLRYDEAFSSHLTVRYVRSKLFAGLCKKILVSSATNRLCNACDWASRGWLGALVVGTAVVGARVGSMVEVYLFRKNGIAKD